MTHSRIDEFETLDLSAAATGGEELLARLGVPMGRHVLDGVPFQIGSTAHPRLVVVDPDTELTIPIARSARAVVIAHATCESRVLGGEFIGRPVATYTFEGGGLARLIRIRERDQIAALAHGAARDEHGDLRSVEVVDQLFASDAFAATDTSAIQVLPRRAGPWSDAGLYRCRVGRAYWGGLKLWTWTSTLPGTLDRLRVRAGPRDRLVIAAITLSLNEPRPLAAPRRRRLVVEFPVAASRDIVEARTITVSGGASLGLSALRPKEASGEMGGQPGWGSDDVTTTDRAYAVVGARPTSTVTIHGEGTFCWGDLLRSRSVTLASGSRVVAEGPAENRVRVRIEDRRTRLPIPCRISITAPSGVPYAPYGHPATLEPRSGWNLAVGGDVRLGATTFAYVDGTCEVSLPTGPVLIEISKGFEWHVIVREAHIQRGLQQLTIELDRWADLRAAGWFSGDPHAHFLSLDDACLEATAEDLAVVHVLAAQWGELVTGARQPVGTYRGNHPDSALVVVGQEARHLKLGHLSLLGLSELVLPLSTDGPAEGELAGELESTLASWADAGRKAGGTVIAAHFGHPLGELSALVGSGRVDALEMIWQSEFSHRRYYQYLNAGFRLPLVAGTDKMSNETPVGIYRTYVNVGLDHPFSPERWLAGVRAGRTFISAGILLDFRVNGRLVGDQVVVSGRRNRLHVEATARSLGPIGTLEVVANGRVVAEAHQAPAPGTLVIDEVVSFNGSGWLAARASGGATYFDAPRTRCAMRRGIMAHTSPVYVVGDSTTEDRKVIRGMIQETAVARRYVTARRRGRWANAGSSPDLDGPFREALAALRARLDRTGG